MNPDRNADRNDERIAVRRKVFLVVATLCLLAAGVGCGQKPQNRAQAERQFLAPTDVNKLTPEARAHLPGQGKFQPTGPGR